MIRFGDCESDKLVETMTLSAKCMGVIDVKKGCRDLVGGRRFSSLGFLAGDKPFELASELFPLS